MSSSDPASTLPALADDGAGTSALGPGPRDSWHTLTRYTAARIALGRSGGSLRTDSLLDFRLSHARAKDAVQARFAVEELAASLKSSGVPVEFATSAAAGRHQYLMRPDLGRRLAEESRKRLSAQAAQWGKRDLLVMVSDGLAAQAAHRHAAETVTVLLSLLACRGWTFFPVLLVPFARVKLQDEVGELLDARHSLILLGERPGLGSPDSLGAYLTYRPRSACTDADRNCVSNIREEGLPPREAAMKLAGLLVESERRKLSGVGLKEQEVPPSELPSS